ncbi:MAG: glycogen synthase GlgA [Candidatus Competibacteraceae bacterium]
MSVEPIRVLYVSSEVYPLAKTGGLGDVSSVLPSALRQLGVDARILMPAYPGVVAGLMAQPVGKPVRTLPDLEPAQLFQGTLPEALPGALTPVYAISSPLYDRPGGPYVDVNGSDWPDNAIRFGVLSKVAALFGRSAGFDDWRPHIIHCNDWQSGLAPAYLAHNPETRAHSVMNIHNLAFQGNFSPELLPALGLPWSCFHIQGVEFHGQISFLKAGLYYADHIVTVSPRYACEIQTPEFGFGLQGLLNVYHDRLTGILNGIDADTWNPETDPYLATHYSSHNFYGKAANKCLLQKQLALNPEPDQPLLALVTRLTYQKGIDLVLALAEELLRQPLQFAVLGSGDKAYEAQWRALAEEYPGQVGVMIGYDEQLAHLLEAGADLFLMPSRFEPCGLNQMYSMRYGTLPLVRCTGGLADSVVDTTPRSLLDRTATGFVFEGANRAELLACILRALLLYGDRHAWHQVQHNGMRQDFSWTASAAQYLELYRQLLANAPALARPRHARSML